ncbi:MAG TPA: SCO family protein [Stellaceae bacterium]|nr:SCO family protein [Stellaceae bacterium]
MLLSAIGGALVALAAVALFISFGRPARAELPVIGTAPHFRLTDQNGRSVSPADFAGKLRIVAPLFPYCRELCPLVAANLAEFNDRVVQRSPLKGRVEFVFFNIAPAASGPPEMRQFLKQYGWDPKDSSVEFLTGAPQAIRAVVQSGYHIGYYRTAGDTDGDSPLQIKNALADRKNADFDVKHADIIEVVDGKGRIRKIFTSGSRVSDMRLEAVLAALETSGSGG